MTAAALAAAATAIQDESAQVAELYLQKALRLYQMAQRSKGLYARWIPSGALYPSTSFYDDLAYAATWIYAATLDENYLNDAMTFYEQSVQTEPHINPNPYMFSYENVIPALDVLLAKFTGDPAYTSNVQDFVKQWLNTKSATGGEFFVLVVFVRFGLGRALPRVRDCLFPTSPLTPSSIPRHQPTR